MIDIIINLTLILIIIAIGSFLIPFFIGRFIGQNGTYISVFLCTFILMFIAIVLLFLSIKINLIYSIKIIKWIKIELINISFGIIIDPLSVIMLFIVTIVAFCANIYSMEYIKTDPHIIRYFSYLSLFTFFMLLLVISENLIQLFIGWEGVGICSYILINFWYCRIQANKASILAIIANKIGDIALLIAASLTYFLYKTNSFFLLNNLFINFKIVDYIPIYILKYSSINNLLITLNNNYIQNYFLEYAIILFIIACIGKSAQFGFHFWLPEAMEGPTPVSSLIHAATMVTAGIFLILRMSNLLILTYYNNILILMIGSITLFFSATIGVTQLDIKKIVAYSTCSQLGYMFLCCGFYGFSHTFFHLFIHAFFKALLFLTAGYIIHLLSNEQDIRMMGGLLKIAPFSYNLIFIGSYALIGFPFLSGYYSKETLIELILNKIFYTYNVYVLSFLIFSIMLSFITVVITLIYSIKSILDIYFFSFNGFKNYINNIHFSTYKINIPLIILSFCSIYFGYLFNELFIGINNNYLGNALNINSNITNLITEYHTYYRVYIIDILIYFMFFFLFLKFYKKNIFFILFKNNTFMYNIYFNIGKKYLFLNRTILYTNIWRFFNVAYIYMYKLIDKGVIEIIGPYGITYKLYTNSIKISKLQTGYIYHYLGYIFIALILLLFIIMYF